LIERNELNSYFQKVGFLSQQTRVVYADRQERIWLAGSGNLRFLRDGNAYWFADQNYNFPELNSTTILSILQTKDGDTWIGTNNGLYRIADTEVEIVDVGGEEPSFPKRFKPKEGWQTLES